MKKIKVIMVLLAGVFLFTACSGGHTDESKPSESVVETSSSTTEETIIEETEEFIYHEQDYERENNLFGNHLQEVKFPKDQWGAIGEDGSYILKNGTQSINVEELRESIKNKAEAGEPLDSLELSFMTESVINSKFVNIPAYRIRLLYNAEPVFYGPRRLNTDNVEDALPLFRSEQLFVRKVDGVPDSEYYLFTVPETLKNTGRVYDKEGEGNNSYPREGSNVQYFSEAHIYVINIEQRDLRFFNYDGKYLGSALSSVRWWEPYDIKVVDGNMAMCYLNGKHQFDITDKDIPSGVVLVSDSVPSEEQYNLVRISNTDPESIGYFVGYLPENGREGIMSRDGKLIGTE